MGRLASKGSRFLGSEARPRTAGKGGGRVSRIRISTGAGYVLVGLTVVAVFIAERIHTLDSRACGCSTLCPW